MKTDDLPSEGTHSGEHWKHIRKRKKRTRKLRDNRELLAMVIVLVICGLVLTAAMIVLLSTGRLQLPPFLRNSY